MITDEAVRQAVYQHILKFTVCRLERAMPGSEGALGHLSLNALLNLLFLVRGEWGSIQPSEFVSNHLNEVEVRFYANAAVAQGNESWKKKDGTAGLLPFSKSGAGKS